MPETAEPPLRALQIFRSGRHTAMGGQTLAFSEADLAATAAAYDPARHEAPLVVGHPRHDAPAYGWVRRLSAGADGLEAEPQQVDAAFAELVSTGRFKKISASFYAPDSPANPVPGVYYLRHVGFLGAQPPAVKGMRDPRLAAFAEDEPGVLEFSDAWDDATVARLWRNLREWLLSKFDAATADQVVPVYEVAGLERKANEAMNREMGLGPDGRALPVPAQAFSEPQPAAAADPAPTDAAPPAAVPADPSLQPTSETVVTPEEAAALAAENARLKADLAAAQAAQRQQRAAAAHAEHAAFAEQLAGVPASRRPAVVALLDHLAAQEAPVEFGEGEQRQPLAQALRELLAGLPEPVAFGELATSARAAGQAPRDGGLSNEEVARRARDLRAQAEARGEALSYGEAVDAVHRQAGHPAKAG